ncbi:MAG TPA: alpha/beta hydrolase [Rhodospirillaceae bacterium]|nr:alpha/beta hydrolase [Rhodospirillaceae bacterium]
MRTEYILGLNPHGFHKLAVHLWGDDKCTDVPTMCVHGLTRNGRDFDRLAERLSATRPVYCPDMAGRGLSDDLPDPADYNFTQYIADTTVLMTRPCSLQVDWVGTSMGGLLGMMLAAKVGTPIHRLVLNDVGPVIPKESLDRIGTYVGEQPVFDTLEAVEAHMRKIYASFAVPTDKDWTDMAANGVRKTPDGRFVLAYDPRIADAFKGENEAVDLWDVYDKITCPTLLIRGAHSDVLPREIAQEMTQRGPRAQLVEIEGAGHAPALMSDEQTNLIAKFLEG